MKKIKVFFSILFFLAFLVGCGSEDKAEEKSDAQVKQESNMSQQDNYFNAFGDMKMVMASIESYKVDNDDKVPVVNDYKDLASILTPFYMKEFPLKDPWGNFFYYKSDGKNYQIASSGSDGKFLGFDQAGSYSNFDGEDIVFNNNMPVYYPEVK